MDITPSDSYIALPKGHIPNANLGLICAIAEIADSARDLGLPQTLFEGGPTGPLRKKWSSGTLIKRREKS